MLLALFLFFWLETEGISIAKCYCSTGSIQFEYTVLDNHLNYCMKLKDLVLNNQIMSWNAVSQGKDSPLQTFCGKKQCAH